MTTGSDYRINDDDVDEIGSMNFKRFLSGKFVDQNSLHFQNRFRPYFYHAC